MNSLDNIFAIACDSYGLTSRQIDNLIESSNVITDSINGWNNDNRDLYIKSYQVLTGVLGSGQKNGVFSLDVASRLYRALIVIKNYILNQTVSDRPVLEENNQFIRSVIQKKVLSKCIYNQTDLKRINLALESLECVFETDKDKDKRTDQTINASRGYNTILAAINKAQTKGKFTLQQANNIMQLLTTTKQRVLEYNADVQSRSTATTMTFPDPLPEPKPEPEPEPVPEPERDGNVSLIKEKKKPSIQKRKKVTIKKNSN